MSEATEQEMRDMVMGLDSVSSDTISLYLADAKAKVLEHGIAEDHNRFSELQRLMALHLLSLSNIAGKNVTSEGVSDVTIRYSDNPGGLGTLYSTNWEREYRNAKTSILGMTGICL